MNTDIFFQQFELLADAPNGIAKLRELILQLAVQGKLVPQNPDDEPAAVLLERIKAEKERLVREGKIRKIKQLSHVSKEEKYYSLPKSWEWSRLSYVYDVRDGTHDSPKYLPQGIPLLTSKNLSNGKLDLTKIKYISQQDHISISARSKVEENDILFAMIGSIGNPVIVDNYVNFSIKNVALFKYYNLNYSVPKYLYYFLVISSIKMRSESSGAVQSFVSLGYLRKFVFPLPPLAEQHRIVEKVDRLMELCDKLETQKQQQQTKTLQLGTVATSRLTAAKTPEAFKQHWQNISNNFDLIYSTPENIKQLRQTILQLAVMGKLVPQNHDDEPASVLLAKIKAEKEKLIKEGKIKKSKKLKAIAPDEIPYEIPKGWEWIRINDGYEVMGGIQKTPKRKPISNYYPYLRVANVYRGKLDLSEIKYFELFEGDLERCKLKKSDLLIVEGNGSEKEIGRCAIWNGKIENCVHQNHIIRARPIKYEGSSFSLLFLNSVSGMEEMKRLAITTSGLYSLSVGKIRGIIQPLPPLAEQHRIVAKVDQLMSYCDELEANLTQSLKDKEKLMDTAVYQLLTV